MSDVHNPNLGIGDVPKLSDKSVVHDVGSIKDFKRKQLESMGLPDLSLDSVNQEDPSGSEQETPDQLDPELIESNREQLSNHLADYISDFILTQGEFNLETGELNLEINPRSLYTYLQDAGIDQEILDQIFVDLDSTQITIEGRVPNPRSASFNLRFRSFGGSIHRRGIDMSIVLDARKNCTFVIQQFGNPAREFRGSYDFVDGSVAQGSINIRNPEVTEAESRVFAGNIPVEGSYFDFQRLLQRIVRAMDQRGSNLKEQVYQGILDESK